MNCVTSTLSDNLFAFDVKGVLMVYINFKWIKMIEICIMSGSVNDLIIPLTIYFKIVSYDTGTKTILQTCSLTDRCYYCCSDVLCSQTGLSDILCL